jgi:hypothetical protein
VKMPFLHIIVTMSDSFLFRTPTYEDELKQAIIAKLRESGWKLIPPFECRCTPLSEDDAKLFVQSRIISALRHRAHQLN